LTRQVFSI